MKELPFRHLRLPGGREKLHYCVYVRGGWATFGAGAKLARGRKRRARLAGDPPEMERMLERDTTFPALYILTRSFFP